jgi:CobQ/CobB/MinD/ParA nucleotide binding domain
VVITSALAGEGKTSTALNLALAIAQSKEKRVLVIDGDLRRPNVATYLGIRSGAGLAEVLEGECEPLDSTVCLDAHELYVMPVKGQSSNPTELLSSERLEWMLEEMREYCHSPTRGSWPITRTPWCSWCAPAWPPTKRWKKPLTCCRRDASWASCSTAPNICRALTITIITTVTRGAKSAAALCGTR